MSDQDNIREHERRVRWGLAILVLVILAALVGIKAPEIRCRYHRWAFLYDVSGPPPALCRLPAEDES